jgi:hypothetical protein
MYTTLIFSFFKREIHVYDPFVLRTNSGVIVVSLENANTKLVPNFTLYSPCMLSLSNSFIFTNTCTTIMSYFYSPTYVSTIY